MTTTHADFIRARKVPDPSCSLLNFTAHNDRLEAIASLLDECYDVLDDLQEEMDCLTDGNYKRIVELVHKFEVKS